MECTIVEVELPNGATALVQARDVDGQVDGGGGTTKTGSLTVTLEWERDRPAAG